MAARITADFPGDVLSAKKGQNVSSAMCQQTMCAGSSTRFDGTFNFVHGFHVATSIAVEADGAAAGSLPIRSAARCSAPAKVSTPGCTRG